MDFYKLKVADLKQILHEVDEVNETTYKAEIAEVLTELAKDPEQLVKIEQAMKNVKENKEKRALEAMRKFKVGDKVSSSKTVYGIIKSLTDDGFAIIATVPYTTKVYEKTCINTKKYTIYIADWSVEKKIKKVSCSEIKKYRQ